MELLSPAGWRGTAPSYISRGEAKAELDHFFDTLRAPTAKSLNPPAKRSREGDVAPRGKTADTAALALQETNVRYFTTLMSSRFRRRQSKRVAKSLVPHPSEDPLAWRDDDGSLTADPLDTGKAQGGAGAVIGADTAALRGEVRCPVEVSGWLFGV